MVDRPFPEDTLILFRWRIMLKVGVEKKIIKEEVMDC
jgi:hypothetical protein